MTVGKKRKITKSRKPEPLFLPSSQHSSSQSPSSTSQDPPLRRKIAPLRKPYIPPRRRVHAEEVLTHGAEPIGWLEAKCHGRERE